MYMYCNTCICITLIFKTSKKCFLGFQASSIRLLHAKCNVRQLCSLWNLSTVVPEMESKFVQQQQKLVLTMHMQDQINSKVVNKN